MIDRFAQAWMAFFFRPQMALNLAVCRIIFFGFLLQLHIDEDFSLSADFTIFWHPIPVFRMLHLPLFDAATLSVLQTVWKVALVFCTIGLATRPAATIALVLGVYLLGLKHNFGYQSHADSLQIVILIVLLVSPCNAAWSLDSWLRKAFKREPAPLRSGAYTWPVRMIQVTFACVFFAAGIAKMRQSGLEWIFSDNMALRLVQSTFFFEGGYIRPDWTRWVAQQSWLCQLLAGMTIILELGYPLALFSVWARWFFVPSMLLAQIAILFLMGPNFILFMLCNCFWVPWDRLLGPPTQLIGQPVETSVKLAA